MNDKNAVHKLLGIAAANVLKSYGNTVLLINMDEMSAALLDVTDKGDCIVKNSYFGVSGPDFYQVAATDIGTIDADELFSLCRDSKRTFRRYLQGGESDGQLKNGVGCKTLMSIYENNYKQNVNQVMDAVKSMISEEVGIILVGKLSAFYPAEHTIRKILTPAPFLPIDRLYVNDRLSVESNELIKIGQDISDTLERNKKCFCHNIMLRCKKLSGTELVDSLITLAQKGDTFDSITTVKFSDSILMVAMDSIGIQADSTLYKVKLPVHLFGSMASVKMIRVGLCIENDVPKLMLKNEKGQVATINIDKNIYSED